MQLAQLKLEFIPVGCIPTTAVAATRCQYWGVSVQEESLSREGALCLGGLFLPPSVNRQTLLKTLMLMAKQFIYSDRCQNKQPILDKFINMIKYHYNIEFFNAKKDNKLCKLLKTWNI